MMQMLHSKIEHHFLHVRQKSMICLLMIYIAAPMCNLIEYSDNYADTLGSLWQFKRD